MSLSLHSSALKRRQQREHPAPILNSQPNQPPLAMTQILAKTVIGQDAPNRTDTDHLLPVIAFLKAQGYTPATGDAFYFDRDGLGTYGFAQPIDTDGSEYHFVFPPTVKLTPTSIYDTRHFVTIKQFAGPQVVRSMSFEA